MRTPNKPNHLAGTCTQPDMHPTNQPAKQAATPINNQQSPNTIADMQEQSSGATPIEQTGQSQCEWCVLQSAIYICWCTDDTCTLYICTTTLVLQPNLAGNNVDGIVDSCGCSVERLCNQLTEVCACFFVAEMHHELVLEIYNVLTALQLWQAR
jgi:hypothetical protein